MTTACRFTRRRLLGTTAGLAVVAATASTPGLAWAQARRGGTLRVSVDQGAGVLNPLLQRVNPEYLLGEMLYSGLTRLGPDMSAEPDLASEWSANDDLSEWTFTLRRGVTFHDGSPLTAEDVVATFEAILDEATGSPARRNIGPVTGVSAQGELAVRFTLSGSYADLPVALAYTNARIVPAGVLRSDMARLNAEAIGTGPFRLVSFEPDRLVVLERNPDYYDPGRPFLDRVEMVVYPDATSEGSALVAGDTDLMLRVNPTDYARLSGVAGIIGLRTPSGQFLNVNMACDAPPFNDPRVRKALALSVDRAALVEFTAEGFGTVGNDTPVNAAYRFHADLPGRRQDYDEARRLMAEAGFADGLTIRLVASERPATRAQLAVALREMARPAGFNIEVQTMAHATYLEQVWKQGNFYVGFYNMQPTADGIFSLLFTSDAAWPETRWNNPGFDALVAEARRTADTPRRAALYADAQRLMNAEVPAVIPVFFDLLAAQRDHVHDFVLHPRGAVFRLDQVWLDENAPTRG
jgi:peptide/nickel transport system substrate-binding protein